MSQIDTNGSGEVFLAGYLQEERTRTDSRSHSWSLKRIFDVSASSLLLFFLLPIFGAVALIIKLSDRGPVFYGHKRIGRDGATFGCLKFRTMRTDGDLILKRLLATSQDARDEWERDRKLRNDPRVTTLGKVLRTTSLDELPQLLNIIRGDMSVVGPRPVTADELPRYGEHLRDYLSVRPGLTGLWQVSGRNDVGYDERVALDVDYVRNHTFAGDLRIIFQTIGVVFMRKGSY